MTLKKKDVSEYLTKQASAMDLADHQREIIQALDARKKENRKDALSRFMEVGRELGFTDPREIRKLLDTRVDRYYHPQHKTRGGKKNDTWTGQGRMPGWMEEWIRQGKQQEDLRIPGSPDLPPRKGAEEDSEESPAPKVNPKLAKAMQSRIGH
jgi:DNA-binding protein H-NS